MASVIATGLLLQALRLLMSNPDYVFQTPLSAYIIPLADAHFGSRLAACDARLAFISGFSGSAGAVIVTNTEAFLWTDGRYFTQAEEQLDIEHWQLMRDGVPGTPSQSSLLNQKLPAGAFVGVDPTLYSKAEWDKMEAELKIGGKNLVPIKQNLVDLVWGADRPNCLQEPLLELGLEFSGRNTSQKLEDARRIMNENSAEIIVLSELDEIAWLLNLRGSDLPSSSVFVAYAIVTQSGVDVFINSNQATAEIRENLLKQEPNMTFKDYDTVFEQLENYVNTTTGKIWLSKTCNYALVGIVPPDRQIIKLGALCLLKAVKNNVEVEGMRNALRRDAATLCAFYSWLETSVLNGVVISEISAADELMKLRRLQPNFVTTSFATISASGSNGAIIHYRPQEGINNKNLSTSDMYLVDAGGLYYDGTTDITRTFHFGTPTEYQRECYTRVLKGQIAIATALFPLRSTGNHIDSFARRALWEVGLDYQHGTGHGIGAFLNVHEQPSRITYFNVPDDQGLRENMFTSNEPGYYEVGQFGIRLENIVRIVNVNLTHNFQNRGFIAIEDFTFAPYQHKLIDLNLLTDKEIEYLNDYQVKVRSIIGAYVQENNMGSSVYDWIIKETEPLSRTTYAQNNVGNFVSSLTSWFWNSNLEH